MASRRIGCDHPSMRTTLDIEAPLLNAIKEIARRERKSAGAVASELIRRALTHAAMGAREQNVSYGFHPFPMAETD